MLREAGPGGVLRLVLELWPAAGAERSRVRARAGAAGCERERARAGAARCERGRSRAGRSGSYCTCHHCIGVICTQNELKALEIAVVRIHRPNPAAVMIQAIILCCS